MLIAAFSPCCAALAEPSAPLPLPSTPCSAKGACSPGKRWRPTAAASWRAPLAQAFCRPRAAAGCAVSRSRCCGRDAASWRRWRRWSLLVLVLRGHLRVQPGAGQGNDGTDQGLRGRRACAVVCAGAAGARLSSQHVKEITGRHMLAHSGHGYPVTDEQHARRYAYSQQAHKVCSSTQGDYGWRPPPPHIHQRHVAMHISA
jgi:hypothetical protein